MKNFISLLIVLFSLVFSNVYAQDEPEQSKVNIGLGFGLDYGGIGGRLTVLPHKNFAAFGAVGYNLFELGFNLGIQARLLPDAGICPTIGAMYGYNGVIVVKGAEQYNKTYYGPSFSFGLEFKSNRNPKNYSNVEILLPIRPSQYKKDFEDLQNNPAISFESKPLPIGISFGFHFGL